MKLVPLHDRIVLQQINVEQQTKSGLIVATTDQSPSDMVYGRVVASGPGKAVDGSGVIPTTVVAGDIVIFKPTAALKYVYLGVEYYIIREHEIASVVEGVVESQYATMDASTLSNPVRQLESLL